MRDLVLVGSAWSSSLTRSLSEMLRARAYSSSDVRGPEVEGTEVLLVLPLRGQLESSLNEMISVAERILGRARRMVLAVPYVGIRASGRLLQYLAGALDLVGADHLIVADPAPEIVASLRTPMVAISAYPEIAKWFSGKAAVRSVAAPPRLENRAEAFAGLVGADLRVMPTDSPGDWGELGGSVLFWDTVRNCGELEALGVLGADYYVVPHVECGEPLRGIQDRVVASDSVDNPYSKVTLAGALAEVVLSL
ncbi:MAG: hypothetical protein ACP5NG_01915 [Conexivisphaera sp.]